MKVGRFFLSFVFSDGIGVVARDKTISKAHGNHRGGRGCENELGAREVVGSEFPRPSVAGDGEILKEKNGALLEDWLGERPLFSRSSVFSLCAAICSATSLIRSCMIVFRAWMSAFMLSVKRRYSRGWIGWPRRPRGWRSRPRSSS